MKICRCDRLQGVPEFAGDITSFYRETKMKSVITGLGMASLLALGSAGIANAQDMMMVAQTYASCNTQYGQCLAASDYTMAMSPQEGMSKIQMNAQHAVDCANALQACYSSMMH